MQNFKTVGEKILERTPYGCRVVMVGGRPMVEMTIGKGLVTMDYKMAIELGSFLRYSGKLAKKLSGDVSKHFTVVADLTDANADELNANISKDRKSVYARR